MSIFTVSDEHVRFTGIEVDGTGITNVGSLDGFDVAAGMTDVRFDSVIVHDLHGGTIGGNHDVHGFHLAGGNVKLSNTIIYDLSENDSGGGDDVYGVKTTDAGSTYYLHNNTIFNINNIAGNGTTHARGIQVNFGTVIARNNLVLNMNAAGGNESFNGAFAGSSNNVSFDANAPGGATSRFNQTAYASYFVNINNGLEDLHLLNDSPTMPELVTSRDGTVRALNRRARTAFRGEGLNPSSAARLLEVGFQGEVKKALVELAPLRWDAARGQLLLARRLVVRVSFRTPDPSEEAIRGRRGRRYRRRRSHDERSVAKRLVTVGARSLRGALRRRDERKPQCVRALAETEPSR